MIPYNLYHVSFVGLWPVGAYAVIAASSQSHAKELFLANLANDKSAEIQELVKFNKDIPEAVFIKYPGTHAEDTWVDVLSYGDY